MGKVFKKVWIFHHYATPPTMNGFTRPYQFGIKLKKYNVNTTVFASSYLHLSDKNIIQDNKLYEIIIENDIPFVFINTPATKGSNGIKRIINMFAFYMRLFKVSKRINKTVEKPDVIIASSPHPLVMVAGIKIAKKLGIPCICEVRDFWPEVIFLNGKLKQNSLVGKVLLKGERWIYRNADALIFLKEGDYTYIIENGWDTNSGGDIDLKKCHYINNGVNLDEYTFNLSNNQIQDEDLESDKFKVIYTGSIRPVNNVGTIIDAAVLLKDYKDIQFLIYGEGNQLEDLKKRVIEQNISNVNLKGYVDKKYIPFILNKSGVNILNYSQEKYNWSRGNSSNKLFEYMASGKPIISTVIMGYNPIDKYNCGTSLENDTPEELAKEILKIYTMNSEEYLKMCINAKEGAKDFDFNKLTIDLLNLLKKFN